MRLLVVGATGYVGRHVTAVARRAGHDVLAHVRPGSPTGDRAAAGFAASNVLVVRTPWSAEAWYRYLESDPPDRVFLLLGTTATRSRAAASAGAPDASQEAVDLGLTQMVLTALRSAAPEAGVIYLSAVGASATANIYLRVRASIESALLSGPNPFAVVRPSFVTGPDRPESRPAERIGAIVGDAALAIVRLLGGRRLAARYSSISGTALAEILVTLAERPLDRAIHSLDDFRRWPERCHCERAATAEMRHPWLQFGQSVPVAPRHYDCRSRDEPAPSQPHKPTLLMRVTDAEEMS
jgi:nucleoside-diphosphate-sugar epimerase